ncbi:MAG: FAD-binding protein [Lachnospiraceae bacterium]|nr:FAD-binding protein [Lachnospiraceae bacterium]
MLRIHQIKIPAGPEADVKAALQRRLESLLPGKTAACRIIKRSLDAREKPRLFSVFSVEADLGSGKKEEAWLRSHSRLQAESVTPVRYEPPVREGSGERNVIVIGAGPAGLFAALALAKAGLKPLLLEQGSPVEERKKDVSSFWNGADLKPYSNVQFGEGGAGTFSDGKLNTGIRDPQGRIEYMLQKMVKAGADGSILYDAKPHLGTDVLERVVKGLREEILSEGGSLRYYCRVRELVIQDGSVRGLKTEDLLRGREEILPADAVILAPGHSARELIRTLHGQGVRMEAKGFAMGLRIQHPQELIDRIQYGGAFDFLPPADYKLTARTKEGRGVFSFCMCPGGWVVNASSEPGRLCVNGMSYADRAGENANSALVVQLDPTDFSGGLFGGMEEQERLERAAFLAAGGAVPTERWEDFAAARAANHLGPLMPAIRGAYAAAELRALLPEVISASLLEAMPQFDKKMPGYVLPDALLCGIESRTSSPVRILRDAEGQSNIRGLFPCGEGAGYAGGITSAAVDGLKCAEAVIRQI